MTVTATAANRASIRRSGILATGLPAMETEVGVWYRNPANRRRRPPCQAQIVSTSSKGVPAWSKRVTFRIRRRPAIT